MKQNVEFLGEQLSKATEIPGWTSRPILRILVLVCVMLLALASLMPWNHEARIELTISPWPTPHSIRAKESGTLTQILVVDGQVVKKREVIAVLADADEKEAIDRLSKIASQVITAPNSAGAPSDLPSSVVDADIQESVNVLSEAISVRDAFNQDSPLLTQGRRAQQRANEASLKPARLKRQVVQQEEIIQLNSQRLEALEELAKRGWVSQVQLTDQRQRLARERIRMSELQDEISDAISAGSDAIGEVDSLTSRVREGKQLMQASITRAALALQARIQDWQEQNFIRAEANGIIRFPSDLKDGDPINLQQEIAVIVPDAQQFVAIGKVPSTVQGYITEGMAINISLASHPAAKYGELEARITRVSKPDLSGDYEIQAELPKNLTTATRRKVAIRAREKAFGSIVIPQGRIYEALLGLVS